MMGTCGPDFKPNFFVGKAVPYRDLLRKYDTLTGT